MSCLYCGDSRETPGPVHVCICGRSGHWQNGYDPAVIECEPQFRTPDWLRTVRRVYYTMFPVNGPIIADAIARTETALIEPHQPTPTANKTRA